MTNVTVIDALMGQGKTTYLFDLMRKNPDRRYMYIGVTIAESERCAAALPGWDIRNPVPREGRKYRGLELAVDEGANIASTHQLFRLLHGDLPANLRRQRYTLIIDEAMDVVSQYKIHEDTFKMLKDIGAIFTDDQRCLRWNHEKWPDYTKTRGKHDMNELVHLCDNGNLVETRRGILMWQFPAAFLDVFEHVYIATYMFEGQPMSDYLKLHQLPYDHVTVSNGALVPYMEHDNSDQKAALAELIRIDMDKYRNAVGTRSQRSYPLSGSWFDKRIKYRKTANVIDLQQLKRLKNSTAAFFREYGELGSIGNMWTCYKDAVGKLRGPRYSKMPTKNANGALVHDAKVNFVSLGTKATDAYKEKQALAFLADLHYHPILESYFDDLNIAVRKDLFALTELVQWLFRSRIRKQKPKPVQLFIPSERMRTILINWIKYSDAQIVAGQRLDEQPQKLAA